MPSQQFYVFLWKEGPGQCSTKRVIWENYSSEINSFSHKSGKVGFPQKLYFDEHVYQISLFTENLNGPYGPYEQLLWDISPNKWPQNRVFDEKSCFWKMNMSKTYGSVCFAEKHKPAGASETENSF